MPKFLLLSFLLFILGLFFAFRVATTISQKSNLPEFGPIDAEITLKESPKFSNQFQIIEIEGVKIFTDIYPRFQVGDVLKISGKANSEGLVFRPKIEKIERYKSALSYLADLREAISGRIDELLPSKEATLVKGMVLGVDDIDKDFREQLIATGTIHAVVVSGQNLSIVAGFFMVLVKYLGRRLSMSLSLLAVLFYAGLTGFEVPLVRALIMVILSYCAVFLGRERLAIWYLVLSAAIIIFIWPSAIFDVSFQLTFAATLGIMTLGRYLANKLKVDFLKENFASGKWKILNSPFDSGSTSLTASAQGKQFSPSKKDPPLEETLNLLLSNAAVATSAYLFTAPIIFWHFGRLSLIAPLVNILVAEAVVPIMILGFAISFTSLIFMPLAQVLAYFAYVPAFYFVKIVEIFGK